jgi:membrane-bound lytic murein transglycosylase MltF
MKQKRRWYKKCTTGVRQLVIIIVVALTACTDSDSAQSAHPGSTQTIPEITAQIAPDDGTPAGPQTQSPGMFLLSRAEQDLPPELALLNQPWIGDFDGMVERRVIRVLTVFQIGGYFLDGPQEKGLTYDLVKMFEKFLNERLDTGHLKLHVVLIPVAFDQLLPALEQGYGDIAAAGLSITPQRQKTVDFGAPLSREVREVIITGPAAPSMTAIDDLSGKTVYIKPGSSYRESLESLNDRFRAANNAEIEIRDAASLLQDMDLLEMVSAGLLPMIVMDDYKARFWAEILDGLQVREDLVVQSGRQIAWAFRKNSPLLAAEVNEFSRTHRQGTLMGNILIKRYLKNTKWVNNALDPTQFKRFENTLKLFKRYSSQYDFDHLMIAALGYQESRLDQSARSSAGAIGIMQLLASTASDANVGIPDIENAESNIHAGVKYLDFLRKRYFTDPELDAFNRALFSFAAYNAGPARVRGLRRKAAEAGLDRNQWFNNVELIAAREIGRETVQYVSNIYKYYLAYRLIMDQKTKMAESG